MPNSISMQEFKRLLKERPKGSVFVDVRTPEEYAHSHIEGIINIPVTEISEHLEELGKYDAIYVHCRAGGRAGRACIALVDQYNLQNVYKVDGGIDTWVEEGLPTI
ncbi:rhodanese-like domain-containing protein [Patescibacteria group bacterium]|nr:rhodanese-like domain-containing protein [Patescibacteria group bacterium]MBU1124141.1 rhodanese-like domain-containing protein [Patescibacteria group bacterium]MBU1911740.1 rhodanese-like domain-containing protein [Patescibacteria group bacterium]